MPTLCNNKKVSSSARKIQPEAQVKMMSVKAFMKTYGTVGVGVYAGITTVSITTFFLALRSGSADSMITSPLEQILGKDSETVKNIKLQLEEARQPSIESDTTKINLAREAAYFGVAGIADSCVLPLKLALSLPLAKQIIKRRGR